MEPDLYGKRRLDPIAWVIWIVLWVNCVTMVAGTARAGTPLRFDFGSERVADGYVQVLSTTSYTSERGYGFEETTALDGINRDGDDALIADFCTSDAPFYFSVKVPEGNYRVSVSLGDSNGTSSTMVKAELRRLMLEGVATAAGQIVQRSFVVNVRTPVLPNGGRVRLKDREKTTEAWAWDDKLTLEFNGDRPCVCAIEVTRVDDIPTVYLLGDSTVCDQPRAPWNSWGQMLTRFFTPQVAIANHAESGESLRSSLDAGRVAKVLCLVKPGDYVVAQFGHNDMKSRVPNASNLYKADLKELVACVRAKGAVPILVTSMERKAGVRLDTLRDYPEKVREVAAEGNVTLIDLHAMSKVLYRALGDDLNKAFQDGTHHNNYGSYELAKCVVEGIRQTKLGLANCIVEDYSGFDPNAPDSIESIDIPVSPTVSDVKPLGS